MESSPLLPTPVSTAGSAIRFIDALLARGRVGFARHELEQAAGLSSIAARHQLMRMGKRVRRVAPRQAFYLIVSPEHDSAGAPPAAWWLDSYFRWLGRPYYVALQSAAAVHGSRQQAVLVTQVMTDRPRRALEIGRVRVAFYVKRGTGDTPVGPLPRAHAPLRVSTPAATIVDLVRYAPQVGGIGRATETLVPLLKVVDRQDFERALGQKIEGATLQRLGFILGQQGEKALAAFVAKRLPDPKKRALVRLNASAPADPDCPVVPSWGVVVNDTVAKRQ